MRLTLFFLLLSNLIFSQNIDELVFNKSLSTQKIFFFNLEKVLLIDSYDFRDAYYRDDLIDNLTERNLPEYINSEYIEFNVFDERKSIKSIPSNGFDHVLIRKNSSDYLSSQIGSFEFRDGGRAIINSTSLVYNVTKVLKNDSFGNEIYTLKLSSSTGTIELPIFRIFESYKLVLNYQHLKSLGVNIIEEKIIPLKTIFNDRIITEELSVSSIDYELRRNSSYFDSYSIIPSAQSIIRTDVFNDNFISKSISKDDILFIFEFVEGR